MAGRTIYIGKLPLDAEVWEIENLFGPLYVKLACRGRGQSPRRRASHRSNFRVVVQGLPSSASWQHVKDHMRKAGDVCFVNVYPCRDGVKGIVHYTNYKDMKKAIRELDHSEFRNHFTRNKAYIIRVKRHDKSPHGDRNRNRSRSRRSRRRCRSRSLARLPRSRSRSRSKSRLRSRSRSRSRSRRSRLGSRS